jgi:glycosyltransferase involved in cell wall biosynthesis
VRPAYKKIAVVHDWLVRPGGAERVLERLLGIFPEADLFTLFHIPGSVPDCIESRLKGVSFLQGLPGLKSGYGRFLPLFPKAVESLPLAGYDLVVSSSYCVAKGAVAGRNARHLCYCHTPMRYVWHQQKHYERRLGLVGRMALRIAARRLRRWDVRTSSRPGLFAANSGNVSGRIREYYHRESIVVHPPVDTDLYKPADHDKPGDYYLSVGALVPYRNIDTAVAAFTRTGRRLLVAGDGPEMGRLRKMAGPQVEFLGWQGHESLWRLYRGCRALVSPGEEDFGMAAAEAQACGKPVVALGKGGAEETVVDGLTGVLYMEDSVNALVRAVESLEGQKFNAEQIRKNAERFSVRTFDRKISSAIESMMGGREDAA